MKASPCASCPWLRENQTPEAIEASPTDARGVHWFAVSNLRERWRFVARGGMLPCHATDRNAPNYGGKYTAAKEGRICVGLCILARRELTQFMSCGMDPARYRLQPGLRFSVKALAMWASMLLHAGATLTVGGTVLQIPKVSSDPLRVMKPWND